MVKRGCYPSAAEPQPNEAGSLTTDCSDYPDGDWFIRAIRVIRGGWIEGELPSSSQAARVLTDCSQTEDTEGEKDWNPCGRLFCGLGALGGDQMAFCESRTAQRPSLQKSNRHGILVLPRPRSQRSRNVEAFCWPAERPRLSRPQRVEGAPHPQPRLLHHVRIPRKRLRLTRSIEGDYTRRNADIVSSNTSGLNRFSGIVPDPRRHRVRDRPHSRSNAKVSDGVSPLKNRGGVPPAGVADSRCSRCTGHDPLSNKARKRSAWD